MPSKMQRVRMLDTLADYYISKGKIYESSLEYSRQSDTPYTIKEIKKIMGSWGMLFRYLDTHRPTLKEDVKEAKRKDRGNLFKDKPAFPKSKVPPPPSPSKIRITSSGKVENE